jgi:thiol:disulfide interchange protein DsbD
MFFVLALGMFGLLAADADGDQTRRSQLADNKGGTPWRRQGALTALIVTLRRAAAHRTLTAIAQTGDVVAASALFAMSMGMGAPLLLVGASAGNCRRASAPG